MRLSANGYYGNLTLEEDPRTFQYKGTTEDELRKVLEVSNQIAMLFAVLSIVLGAVLLSHGLFLVDTVTSVVVSPFVMVLFGVSQYSISSLSCLLRLVV